jgi:hypothetical protein
MEVAVKAGGIDKESVDAMVLMLYEGDAAPQGAAAMIDKALDGAITALRQEGEFTGKPKQQSPGVRCITPGVWGPAPLLPPLRVPNRRPSDCLRQLRQWLRA